MNSDMHRTCFFRIPILLILVNLTKLSHGIDDISKKGSSKPSDFKAKLAKSEFTDTLKHSKLFSSLRSGRYDSTTSDIGIILPPEEANDTIVEDHHVYYNSTFYTSPDSLSLWVDLDKSPADATTHEMLSVSHRQATTIELTFDFPFYGNLLRNVTVATGGFLYMGDYLHNWIAATQYVAPLMANFDTGMSPDSTVKYHDNGTAFTVQWNKVFIQNRVQDGGFTFQSTLHKNGDIIFAYKEIPYPILNISDTQHPVKVGISDAYILEKSMFFVRRKTIYEYHRVDMMNRTISNNTAIYLVALTTCSQFRDCESCVAADEKLECMWCDAIHRCSDGIDRQRQNWVKNRCAIEGVKICPATVASPTDKLPSDTTLPDKSSDMSSKYYNSKTDYSKYDNEKTRYNSDTFLSPKATQDSKAEDEVASYLAEKDYKQGFSVGAIVTIVIFLLSLLGGALWIGYAYKFPQTSSGQFLIKYRPSQWTFKKEESTHTSDSLHI